MVAKRGTEALMDKAWLGIHAGKEFHWAHLLHLLPVLAPELSRIRQEQHPAVSLGTRNRAPPGTEVARPCNSFLARRLHQTG